MMVQISAKLRRTDRGYAHWCEACGEMHVIPNGWSFDGNADQPTFAPSVRITGVRTVVDEKGEWTGEWVRGPDGKVLPMCCHYIVTGGQVQFCTDCTHELAGKTLPLPDLPGFARDHAA